MWYEWAFISNSALNWTEMNWLDPVSTSVNRSSTQSIASTRHELRIDSAETLPLITGSLSSEHVLALEYANWRIVHGTWTELNRRRMFGEIARSSRGSGRHPKTWSSRTKTRSTPQTCGVASIGSGRLICQVGPGQACFSFRTMLYCCCFSKLIIGKSLKLLPLDVIF